MSSSKDEGDYTINHIRYVSQMCSGVMSVWCKNKDWFSAGLQNVDTAVSTIETTKKATQRRLIKMYWQALHPVAYRSWILASREFPELRLPHPCKC